MSTQNAAVPDHEDGLPGADAGGAESAVTVETRFGTMEFDRTRIIRLNQGLLGFPDHLEYGLANLPEERYGRFKLLQCITDPELAFPVLPLDFVPGLIDEADIREALEALGIARESAVVLLIATARKEEDGISISVNLRAPVVVDADRCIGRQYVLSNSKYPIRHVL